MCRCRVGTRRFPVLAATLLSIVLIAGCGGDSPTAPSVGLVVPFSTQDLVVGTGPEAMNGDVLRVSYTGWLYDRNAAENKGTQFDSGTIDFVLGAGRVIEGWDRGLLGVRVGGRRIIVTPPELAYGAAGSPPRIPGNATLLFEVELLGIS
jgi:FKBP-type peptidyl-prolyl cis-trans isomerase FkpA